MISIVWPVLTTIYLAAARRGSIVCNRNWLVNAELLSPACAGQQPMSSPSCNDHNHFDPDNTLSMSARYDFMNEVSCLP